MLFPADPGVMMLVGVAALREDVGEGVDDMIMCVIVIGR